MQARLPDHLIEEPHSVLIQTDLSYAAGIRQPADKLESVKIL
jgi:hypothetical protein